MARLAVVKRAVGEVALIVIGVLIALMASDWQEQRSKRHSEVALLQELSTPLQADFEILQTLEGRYEDIEAGVEVLLAYIGSGAPYADSLDAYFGTLYGFQDPPLNTGGYESLKSQGLGLVSDDALRSHIARVYEQSYSAAQDAKDMERSTILNLLRPYFLVHFRDLQFGITATPIDYRAVSRDPQFINLAAYRLQLARQNHLPQIRQAMSDIRALKDAIAQDLVR